MYLWQKQKQHKEKEKFPIVRTLKKVYRWLRYFILNPRNTAAIIMPRTEQLAKIA